MLKRRQVRTARLVGIALVCFITGRFFPASGLGVAYAADDPEALIAQGLNLRKAGDDEGAYRLFVRSYETKPTPRAAAQMGLCEFNLARWIDAEVHLSEALRATNNVWVEKNRAALTEVIYSVKKKLGRVEVTGRPAGADVEVAGRAVGKLPLSGSVRAVAGEVLVRVEAPGYETERKTVTVGPNQLVQVAIDLLPSKSPGSSAQPTRSQPASGQPRLGSTAGGDSPGIASGPQKDPAPSGEADWRPRTAWIAGGAALVLIGAGTVGALLYNDRITTFNNPPKPTVCATTVAGSGGYYCRTLLSQSRQFKALAIAGFAGAGLAALLATYAIVTMPDAKPVETDTTPSLPPPPEGALRRRPSPSRRVACMFLGPAASCALTF